MIEWLSDHDETTLAGASSRYRIGKPSPAFLEDFARNPEHWKAKGYEIFTTSSGPYVKALRGVLLEPPTSKTPPPRPPSFLRDFQRPHFKNIWEIFGYQTAAGDFSDTGTGKTYVTVATALELDLPLFVVCLLSGMDKWKKVIREFGAKAVCVGNYEHFKTENDFGTMDAGYFPARIFHAVTSASTAALGSSPMFNPFPKTKFFSDYAQCLDYLFKKSTIRPQHLTLFEQKTGKSVRILSRVIRGYKWNLPKNTFMVFDEVHKCKSDDSQNMRLLSAAKPYVTEGLTATPGITPRDFKALGYVLGLHNLYDFDLWTEKHGCRRVYTRGAKPKFIGWDYAKGSGGIEDLNKELYPLRAARMRISEIPDFPKTQITAESYSAKEAPEIQRAYLETVAYCKNEIRGKRMLQVTAILRYRMLAEKLKIPLFMSLMEEANEQGFAVAMFVNFKETLALLHQKYPNIPMIYGTQKKEDRERGRLLFENNKVNKIFLNIQAGGTSLDLHDLYGVPRMALISPTYNPYDLKQVFGRVHRDGSLSTSIQRMVYMADTEEDKVCAKAKIKLKAFATINGDPITERDLIEDTFLDMVGDEVSLLTKGEN